jgi:hypothetical protein
MPHLVLSEDWSEYDNKKKKHTDAQFFSCDEPWEREYLVRTIRKVYSQYSNDDVETAISACCKAVPAPRPRKAFVECVMFKLRS